MKKIYKYLLLKISSYRILGIIIIILAYQFGLFFELIGQSIEYNIYDLLMQPFDYLPLFIVISLGYLLIMYNLCDNSNFYKYLHLKFKNRVTLFNVNVSIIFILSICFTLLLNIVAIVESIGKLSFKNLWTPYFFYKMDGKINVFYEGSIVDLVTKKLTPFRYVLYTNIFIILYLALLGLLFLVINNYINKRPLTFVMVIGINAINRIIDSHFGILGKISFTHNIYILTSNKDTIYNNTFIFYRLIYWCVFLSIVYFIGRFSVLKIDCEYGD
ncbi:TPA: hypothetical protein PTV44_001883 [Clostridium botulinum]|nr:hypothetical protein [Clostridium botulinum]